MISFFAPPRDGRGLTVCSECGAVVAPSQDKHRKWHAGLDVARTAKIAIPRTGT